MACEDPTVEVVDVFIAKLEEMFDGGSPCPPRGGGIEHVRFFAADNQGMPPLILPQCPEGSPHLLWVRLDRRYWASLAGFPGAEVGDGPCGSGAVVPTVAVEVGVARCSSMEALPDWSTLTLEAEVSMDDSWRLSLALEQAKCALRSKERAVAIDTVAPIGPAGGAMAWTGMAYVQLGG